MERLEKKCEEIGITLSDTQKQQLKQYYDLLVEWNSFMNLTAITEWDEVCDKHFLDSVMLAKYKDLNQTLTVLDLGTGAGFPGIPLKIVFPTLKVTLMDSLNKRVKFLNTVIEELSLDGIKAIHSRAEDGARNVEYREQYDLVVSRAVANLSTLSEYCLPYVKIGGEFVSYKSGDVDEELKNAKNAIFLLGGKQTNCYKTVLPETDIERSFVEITKVSKTPKAYPRKAGTATKNPL